MRRFRTVEDGAHIPYLQRKHLPLRNLGEVLLAVGANLQDAPSPDDGCDQVPVLVVQVHTPQKGLVLLFHPSASVVTAPIAGKRRRSAWMGRPRKGQQQAGQQTTQGHTRGSLVTGRLVTEERNKERVWVKEPAGAGLRVSIGFLETISTYSATKERGIADVCIDEHGKEGEKERGSETAR